MHEQLTQWWESISLRSKITGVTVFVVTVGLLVVGVGTLTVLQRTLVDEVDRQLRQAADELPGTFAVDEFDSFDQLTPSIFSNPFYFGAVDADGVLIDDNITMANRAQAPDVSRLTLAYVSNLEGGITLTSADRTTQWRVATFPLRVTEGDSGASQQATLIIGADLADANAIIGSFASIFLGFGLVVVILSAALTRLLVTSTFRPLRDVEATAARFAGGDFSQRLSGATPNTEVGRLSGSLNAMLSRIDRAFADRAATISQMRRFVGDASHELRTPLVSVRGYAELYRMGALTGDEQVGQAMERIEKEAIRMSALVSDLLELARLDESRPLEPAPVDLVPLARDAALDARAGAPDREVTVVIEIPTTETPATDAALTHHEAPSIPTPPLVAPTLAGSAFARLRGRRSRRASAPVATPEPLAVTAPTEVAALVLAEENKIRQVITNLIGNALRFSPDGTPIELVVGVDHDAGLASIAVVDHGDGIPPQLQERIFERFFRADSSRTRDTGGSGLGLAIVASIVALHNGRVEVLDTPGGGATFRVSLPLLPSAVAAKDAPAEPLTTAGAASAS
ncbi:sensor histidine kinase [Microcella sp.]|uniref:sensor histidine kinase n=1 Tax=Microcella sp. TaxID=1913979 RepID=UPI00256AF1BE|nr:HAMP domain-containing sensor histidine kinase [Microcella sp.]MBX9471715.1 HAMP domain-containing histidine kinase [Microcella sp.]